MSAGPSPVDNDLSIGGRLSAPLLLFAKFLIFQVANYIMSDAFKALSHPIHRQILGLLKTDAKSSGDLTEAFSVSWPTISNHLSVLKEAQLVTTERRGTTILYHLNPSKIEQIGSCLLELIGQTKATSKAG